MFKSSKIINKVNIKRFNSFIVLSIVFLWMGTLVASNYANHQTLRRNDLDKKLIRKKKK